MKNRFSVRGDVITIYIPQSDGSEYKLKIDAEDFPLVDRFSTIGVLKGTGRSVYAVTRIWDGKYSVPHFIHRIVNKTPPDQKCIFIKAGDPFDCRKKNLRNVDEALPRPARRVPRENRCIKVRKKQDGTPIYYVTVEATAADRKKVHIGSGTFPTIEEARTFRDQLQRERNAWRKRIVKKGNVTKGGAR
jgi:hypothetical protein